MVLEVIGNRRISGSGADSMFFPLYEAVDHWLGCYGVLTRGREPNIHALAQALRRLGGSTHKKTELPPYLKYTVPLLHTA